MVNADDFNNVGLGATIATITTNLTGCQRSTGGSRDRTMWGFIALRGGNSENMNIQNIFIGGIDPNRVRFPGPAVRPDFPLRRFRQL